MKNPYVLALCGFVILAVAAGWLLGRLAPRPAPRRAPPSPVAQVLPEVGRFYSVDNADGGYRVVKVLDRSAGSLEVRMFGNHFVVRPNWIDESKLTLEPSDGYAGPGFASLTVTPQMFMAWKPAPIASGRQP
jgi:hypothetical protein